MIKGQIKFKARKYEIMHTGKNSYYYMFATASKLALQKEFFKSIVSLDVSPLIIMLEIITVF